MKMKEISPDTNISTPQYLQIAKNIKAYITDNNVDAGEALPSERELCALTGVSRVTIRKALDELVKENFVERRHGAGTFILPPIAHLGSSLQGFTSNAYIQGHSPQATWLMKAYGLPTVEEADILKISSAQKVVRLGRVRLFESQPVAIEHAVVPAILLPDISEIFESLYQALEVKGNRPVKGRQKVQASLANPTEAGLLSVAVYSEVLRIERRSFLKDDTPVELTRSAYRGDRYDVVMDLESGQLN